MKKNWLKQLLPHVIAIGAILLLAVIYCKPSVEGKILSQSDNVQWQAMAKESMDYAKVHGITPLWTTSMFGGMPTYQIAMQTPNDNFGSYIPAILTLGLPKPINVLFLSALCFYILCMVLRVNPWIGFLGAIAFTYSSYSPIIIATGHDSKMLAMSYMPAVLAGIILITRRQYHTGAAIITVFLAYLVGANHLQMTYYFFLLLGVFGISFIVYCIREKQIKHLILSAAIIFGCIAVAIGYNSVTLWTTYEYSKASNRGGRSELTPPEGQAQYKTTDGLSKDYAFEWSYGLFETFTLIAPAINGGSSGEELGTSSATYKQMISLGVPETQAEQMIKRWPLYWGKQSIIGTSGPVYFGVIICLLAILGLFIIKSWHKWWLIAITVIAIFMAWGSNLQGFNYPLFDHLPFYNKFRAPAQALIIPQLTVAILAIMALQELIEGQIPKPKLFKDLKWTGIILGGLLAILLLISGSLSYTNATGNSEKPGSDDQFRAQLMEMAQGNIAIADNLITALKSDRESNYQRDVIRSLVLAGLAFGLLWFFLKGKLNAKILMSGIVLLVLFDLLQVDRRYLNNDNYMDNENYNNPFQPTEADKKILQDKDPYYRVYNLSSSNPFIDAMTSYYHKSIGGYHAAKLQIYQDLIERQLSKNNIQVLNMLNTKYVIQRGANGEPEAHQNPDALGNAWFVKQIVWVPNADAEMKALDDLNPKDTVVIDQRFHNDVQGTPVYDSAASIHLIANNLNTISYESNAASKQFAVFSEIYYQKGWNAFIDNKAAPYCRVNYALRGMEVPAGKHTIEFRFEPASYYSGIKLSLTSFIIMLVLIISSIAVYVRNRQKKAAL